MLEHLLTVLDGFVAGAVDGAWGWPLVILLIGGGSYLTLRSRFIPFFGARHAIDVIRGKFDDPNDPGEISHFQALMTALSSTIGVGNIAGVAVAISQGGPGAVFWMWVAAIVGMGTKFFTCTLACMYREKDENGVAQGGPMYYIEVGLGKQFRYLAVLFSLFGLIGALPLLQINQLAEVLEKNYHTQRWLTGVACAVAVAVVSWGGIRWIGKVTSKIVPLMCGLYVLGCLFVLAVNWAAIPDVFLSIVSDAFSGQAVGGGAAGFAIVIITGVRRAAFSNEAGVGTAALAHGAAKTDEPVREGLVAMLGPFIDTIVICSLTAFVILSTGSWVPGLDDTMQGAQLTVEAFDKVIPGIGGLLVVVSVTLFAVSTMLGYSYYGRKCFAYLFGARRGFYYEIFYVASIAVGALWSISTVVNILDTAFALMAFPNMIATLMLAPRVVAAMRTYFNKQDVL